MKLPSHVTYIKGKHPGPCAVIMGTLHGNEPIGAMVIEELKNLLKPAEIHGEIYLILGNPKAYEKNQRFIDCDINRIFNLNFSKPYNTEEKRVLEIAPILEKADFLLDIHSTQKPSIPFIYTASTSRNLELAAIFETKFIVSGNKKFKAKKTTMSADNFVDNNSGIGITYESGWNEDLTKFEQSLQKSKEFLCKIGITFLNEKPPKASKTIFLEVQARLMPTSKSFQLSQDYENFDFVKSGETLATENNQKITKPYDCYIIFPKKEIEIDKPACYLAQEYV